MIVPLAVGNALRVFLEPPAGALNWRVLRKTADTFVDQNDPNALLVYAGDDRSVLDTQFLQNGTLYYYRAYSWDGTAWTAGATVTATPNATYQDACTDVLSILRDRIALGMQVEIQRGTFTPQHGVIKVLVSTPIFEDTRWPIVSVHLLSETPVERALGEDLATDVYDGAQWTESEGWMADVQVAVIAWCLNPDERIELRKALRRIVIANLPVFDSHGIVKPTFNIQDVDAVSGEYPAPVFQAAGTFSCVAPMVVGDQVDPITDVQVTVTSTI